MIKRNIQRRFNGVSMVIFMDSANLDISKKVSSVTVNLYLENQVTYGGISRRPNGVVFLWAPL